MHRRASPRDAERMTTDLDNGFGNEGAVTRRYRVTGRVQGVFFRASTRKQALALDMTGHAINLADASVEVLATGSETAHRQLHAWLQQGPEAAIVESVIVEMTTAPAVADPAPAGFTTG